MDYRREIAQLSELPPEHREAALDGLLRKAAGEFHKTWRESLTVGERLLYLDSILQELECARVAFHAELERQIMERAA